MRAVLLAGLLLVGCSKPQLPAGFGIDEINPGDSTELYRGEKVKLTLKKSDGGAYLYLRGLRGGLDFDAAEASAVAEQLAKYDAFRNEHAKDKEAQSNAEAGKYEVAFTKDPKFGFSASVRDFKLMTSVLLDKKDVDGILPHLRNAQAILDKARQ